MTSSFGSLHLRKKHENQTFVPLVEMEPSSVDRPICLLNAYNHYYSFEIKRSIEGELHSFNWPELNYEHQRLRNAYPSICNNTDFSLFLNTLPEE